MKRKCVPQFMHTHCFVPILRILSWASCIALYVAPQHSDLARIAAHSSVSNSICMQPASALDLQVCMQPGAAICTVLRDRGPQGTVCCHMSDMTACLGQQHVA